MKWTCGILVLAVAALVFCPTLMGQERVRDGQVRGTFVRLAEQRVGEREHLAVVVKPLEGKEMETLLVPRDSELAAVAKRLRKGQRLEIAFVVDGGRKWARRIEGEGLAEGERDKPRPEGERDKPRPEGERDKPRREGERDRPRAEGERAGAGELRVLVLQLQKRVERVEVELKELRAETARLREALGPKPAVKKGSGEKPAAKKGSGDKPAVKKSSGEKPGAKKKPSPKAK